MAYRRSKTRSRRRSRVKRKYYVSRGGIRM